MLADLLQMWSLTRTHGESAINHMLRFEHYKVQGRQPLSSRSELIKKKEKRKRISVPVFTFVFKRIALKDIIHPFPRLCPILFQGWSAFCLVPFVLTQMTVLGKSAAFRLSCTLAGPGQECACLAFVQESLDATDTGDQEGKEHIWELAQHLGLQAFVTTCLKGEGGHGNYAKAMHYPDKVIHQIISHNFNSSLEFSLPLSQLDIILLKLLKGWNTSHGAKGHGNYAMHKFLLFAQY